MTQTVYNEKYICGPLAQLAERLVDVEEVTGSSPVQPTLQRKCFDAFPRLLQSFMPFYFTLRRDVGNANGFQRK